MGFALLLCSNYFFTYVLIERNACSVLVGVKKEKQLGRPRLRWITLVWF
jgi:hypothetical protein